MPGYNASANGHEREICKCPVLLADERGAGNRPKRARALIRTKGLQVTTSRRHKMIYDLCTETDPGLARDNNEDAVAFDPSTGLCILADGMGGYNAGEIASGMATAFIKSEMCRWLSQAGRRANTKEVKRAMEICVQNANHSIFNAANSNPQYARSKR